jgi:hypothetical protein
MKDNKTSKDKLDQIIADNRRYQDERAKSYRERAMKMYPWICGRCSREFIRKNLAELTVHHRDHNHDYNPLDGSNWELLCLYCHDNEHQRQLEANGVGKDKKQGQAATSNPFANLKDMLKGKQ